jgi:Icc-related predicted phosphoesterase
MFQFISDLHLDFHKDCGADFIEKFPVLADTLVIAGDISEYNLVADILTSFSTKYKDVVYVPGNHEYYNTNKKGLALELAKVPKNVHTLVRNTITIAGQRFVGSTLWFDPEFVSNDKKSLIADFAYIKDFNLWYADEYWKDVQFFRAAIKPGDVVITHHAPSQKQIAEKYIGSPLNIFFANNLDNLILQTKPKYWLSGHTHQRHSYIIGDTQLEVNPFGYPFEGYNDFDDTLTLGG